MPKRPIEASVSLNPLEQSILDSLHVRGEPPRELRDLARMMGIGRQEMGDFRAACQALRKSGRIVLGARDAVTLPPPPGKVIGTFRANPRGFGFIIPELPNSHGDLFVPPERTAGALTGDTVSARVVKRGRRFGQMRYEARIVDIIRRGHSRFVGELQEAAGRTVVIPDGNVIHGPIHIGDRSAKRAGRGDQVVVEILSYPSERAPARGVIVKVLGRRGAVGVDAASIMEQYQLPDGFPEPVLEEARRTLDARTLRRQIKRREDLRQETVITIDPEDARDFDDAVSLKRARDGTVELGVHIADVAFFVPQSGALDAEARKRATSVYLPNQVIPMLPEVLSNGLCSLQERQTRLTKSVFIRYDRNGRVRNVRTADSVIRSAKRLTYEQAQSVLDNRPGRIGKKVVDLVHAMEKLARAIRRRRLRDGMLELDLPETDLVMDEDGRVIDVRPADAGFSHKMIEMFMVEANEAVARLLTERGVRFLYRIHPPPAKLLDGTLQRFLSALGHDLPKRADRAAVQSLLNEVRGTDSAFSVHLAVLRSMQPAEYAPRPIGHYALASDCYCHFTSPIRRYPDLTVHRLLGQFSSDETGHDSTTEGPTREAAPPPAGIDLNKLGRHCSSQERNAEDAERELRLVYTLRLLQRRTGDSIFGTVTSIGNIGVFVQLDRYRIDGLVPFDELPDDWWNIDAAHCAIVGERTGQRISVSDRLEVVIQSVSIATRRLTLGLNARGDSSSHRRTPSTRPAKPKTRRRRPHRSRATRKR